MVLWRVDEVEVVVVVAVEFPDIARAHTQIASLAATLKSASDPGRQAGRSRRQQLR